MPELPEVESTRLSLEPALLGKRILRAEIRRPDICQTVSGAACSPRDALEGATIAELLRHGKQLALVAADGRVLVVQLGMTGSLRVARASRSGLARGAAPHGQPQGRLPVPSNHEHALWLLDSGHTLIFRDPRRFGALTAYPTLTDVREHRWSALGPDATTIRGPVLHTRAGKSRRAIKAALLDQSVLAGVGNIYADEALFRARIRPTRRANRLSPHDYATLAKEIRKTLRLATFAGGSTIRDYIDGSGRRGRAQLAHAVYDRAGQKCLRCRTRLRATRVAQRATVYCPRCQE